MSQLKLQVAKARRRLIVQQFLGVLAWCLFGTLLVRRDCHRRAKEMAHWRRWLAMGRGVDWRRCTRGLVDRDGVDVAGAIA